MAASSVAVAGLTSPTKAADPTEGYFIVYEDRMNSSEGEDDTRIFFISSEWLSYFEVTDAYVLNGIDPAEVVTKIRGLPQSHSKLRKVRLFYGDGADIWDPLPGLTLIPPTPPQASETYLAAMISPPAIL